MHEAFTEARLGPRPKKSLRAAGFSSLSPLVFAISLALPANADPGSAELPPYVVPPPPPLEPAQPAVQTSAATAPSTPRERSTVEMARLDAGVFYVRGAKMIGQGTLIRYHVLVGVIDLDVTRFPHERLGFEIHVNGGPVGFDENARVEIGLSGAGLVAPLRWKGKAPGSFVLGIGGAFELGRPVWLDPGVHGAPFALARFRIFPNETFGLQTTYRFVPIATDDLSVQEHDVDLGVSYGLLQLSARLRVDEATGGEPVRTYRSIGGGLFVGFAVF
jgi:hypothetical protein